MRVRVPSLTVFLFIYRTNQVESKMPVTLLDCLFVFLLHPPSRVQHAGDPPWPSFVFLHHPPDRVQHASEVFFTVFLFIYRTNHVEYNMLVTLLDHLFVLLHPPPTRSSPTASHHAWHTCTYIIVLDG